MAEAKDNRATITVTRVNDTIVRYDDTAARIRVIIDNGEDFRNATARVVRGDKQLCTLRTWELDKVKVDVTPSGLLQWKKVNAAENIEISQFPVPKNTFPSICEQVQKH